MNAQVPAVGAEDPARNENRLIERVMEIRDALEADIAGIISVLGANRHETSLFQQPEHQVRRTLGDFVMAVDETGNIQGCAALHFHAPCNAEILAVAVAPQAQGTGVGNTLMKACTERAVARTRDRARLFLWLATAKPAYFARFGFRAMSRFRLPLSVLWTKFLLVFQQPPARWVPALFGRHTFMRYLP